MYLRVGGVHASTLFSVSNKLAVDKLLSLTFIDDHIIATFPKV